MTAKLNLRFAGLAVEHAAAMQKNVESIETMQGRHTIYGFEEDEAKAVSRTIATAARDIDRDTRRIVGSVKEGAAKDYLRHIVEEAGPGVDILAERTKLAGLIRVPGVIESIQDAANDWVVEQLDRFRVQIKHTSGATKDAFLRVQGQTTTPEPVTIELPTTLKAPTKESNAVGAPALPRFSGHLFADGDGDFPAKLNSWETTVLEAESARPEFVAWYRNPSRATVAAHRIGYQNSDGDWTSLQVDFLIVSELPDGGYGVSLVDPHGAHLADTLPKLRGLAAFADAHGDEFIRIEAIAEVGGVLRVLDLQRPEVREAIERYSGAQATGLYEGHLGTGYL